MSDSVNSYSLTSRGEMQDIVDAIDVLSFSKKVHERGKHTGGHDQILYIVDYYTGDVLYTNQHYYDHEIKSICDLIRNFNLEHSTCDKQTIYLI